MEERSRARLWEEEEEGLRSLGAGRSLNGLSAPMGWELFQTRNLEELLLPLGRALAWSYWQEGEAEMEAKTTEVDAKWRWPARMWMAPSGR